MRRKQSDEPERLAIRLPPALIKRGKLRALREGRSLTKLLEELLADYLKRVGEPEERQKP
jgi:predicted HicB family RNase H-like nuclease